MLDSLAACQGAPALDVGVLDLGLEEESRARFARRATLVVPPWHYRPHPTFDKVMKWRSRSARPFLRELFPGYDVYVWLDADTFVQSPTGLEWLVRAATHAGTAVVPAVDRSYVHHPKQVEWLRRRYEMAFGAQLAQQLMSAPYINAGVFAFAAGSPFWERWQARFQEALERWQGDFLSDQAVLNGALLLDRIAHARLPATCNWICHLALPRWLAAKRLFLEPSFPYAPLYIVHNTLDEKHKEWPLRDEAGNSVLMRIAYPGPA